VRFAEYLEELKRAPARSIVIFACGHVELVVQVTEPELARIQAGRVHPRFVMKRYPTSPIMAILLEIRDGKGAVTPCAAFLNLARIDRLRMAKALANQERLDVHFLNERGEYVSSMRLCLAPVDALRIEAMTRKAMEALNDIPLGTRDFAKARDRFIQEHLQRRSP